MTTLKKPACSSREVQGSECEGSVKVINRGDCKHTDDMIHSRQNQRMTPFMGGMHSDEDCYQMMDYFFSTNIYQPMPSSQPYFYHPGMKDVPAWLKTLRLHKYTSIFLEMTYEQMLSLSDIVLDQLKVTKGARGKIMQSIEKLRKRPEQIRQQLENIHKGNNPACRCAIILLRQQLCTPIKPFPKGPMENSDRVDGFCAAEAISDENLPGLLTHLLIRVHGMIFNNNRVNEVNDDYIAMLFKVYDLVIANEAFTDNQKRRVMALKKKARAHNFTTDLRRNRGNAPHSGKCDSCQQRDQTLQNMMAAYEQQQRQLEMQDFFNVPLLNSISSRQQMVRNVAPPAPVQPPQRTVVPRNAYGHMIQGNNNANMNNLVFKSPPPMAASRPLQPIQPPPREYQMFGGCDPVGMSRTVLAVNTPRREESAMWPSMSWFNPPTETREQDPPADPRISRIPQYRSGSSMQQQAAAPVEQKLELRPSTQPLWSTAVFDSIDLIGTSTSLSHFPELTTPAVENTASLWSPQSGVSQESGSSGYASSNSSDRGSGAGSPPTRTQCSLSDLESEEEACAAVVVAKQEVVVSPPLSIRSSVADDDETWIENPLMGSLISNFHTLKL